MTWKSITFFWEGRHFLNSNNHLLPSISTTKTTTATATQHGAADGNYEKMVIRTCALDSGTLTLDTELVRMSHCGSFVLDGRSASPRHTNTIKSSISFFSSSGRQFFSRENETPPRAHQSSSSPAEISSSVFCLDSRRKFVSLQRPLIEKEIAIRLRERHG